jgi:uncharacterized membrane protein YidH (DUF202 family)
MSASSDRGGLQPERTSLAWQRTAIAATVIMVPLVVANLRLGSTSRRLWGRWAPRRQLCWSS